MESPTSAEDRMKRHQLMELKAAFNRADPVTVLILVKEWDEDENGTTDRREFRSMLPVLGLRVSRDDANSLFSHLLQTQAERLAAQEAAAYAAAVEAAVAADEKPPKAKEPTPPPSEIDHWMLFRLLAEGEGVDIEAEEKAARERLEALATRHQMGGSAIWSRDVHGKAVNRHALRKRDEPMTKGWNPAASLEYKETLGTSVSVEDALRRALSENLTRVIELFRAWDENGDGTVSKVEFRRAVSLFGLRASRQDVDMLFDKFDPNNNGTIEFWELNQLMRRTLAPAAEAPKAPKASLLGGGKWNKSSAKLLLGVGLTPGMKPAVVRLREAVARDSVRIIELFRAFDTNADGRISREEFVARLPEVIQVEGGVHASDVSDLFDALDPDRSGTLEYRELDAILRKYSHAAADSPLANAHTLLRRSDLVFVLGEPTRAKKTLCMRLAYAFRGTWLTVGGLVERELSAFGSKLAPDIRRRLEHEPPRPLPTSTIRKMLEAAVKGRLSDGPLPPIRGPYFLYDIPRSARQLEALEAAFGRTPLAIDFSSSEKKERRHGGDTEARLKADEAEQQKAAAAADAPEAAAAAAASAAAESETRRALAEDFKERGTLLALEPTEEVKVLVERVAKHLSVRAQARVLKATAERRDAERQKASVMAAQRQYLEASATLMSAALKQRMSVELKLASQKLRAERTTYIERIDRQQERERARRELQTASTSFSEAASCSPTPRTPGGTNVALTARLLASPRGSSNGLHDAPTPPRRADDGFQEWRPFAYYPLTRSPRVVGVMEESRPPCVLEAGEELRPQSSREHISTSAVISRISLFGGTTTASAWGTEHLSAPRVEATKPAGIATVYTLPKYRNPLGLEPLKLPTTKRQAAPPPAAARQGGQGQPAAQEPVALDADAEA